MMYILVLDRLPLLNQPVEAAGIERNIKSAILERYCVEEGFFIM
jgi:hypothetical protein